MDSMSWKQISTKYSEIIPSDILGKAFEPEQRFEERDESDIIFNVDFYGNHRGVSTIPGPLAK